jgi:hypothetical protein
MRPLASLWSEHGVNRDNSFDVVHRYLRQTPPTCLRRFRLQRAGLPKADFGDFVSSWLRVCPCGCRSGEVLGHPLRGLGPVLQKSQQFVSPLAFRCSRCRRRKEIIDTERHGEGSVIGELGCNAYRGKGRRSCFHCPKCAASQGAMVAAFSYPIERVCDFIDDPAYPLAECFCSFGLYGKCSKCRRRSLIAGIDTKC